MIFASMLFIWIFLPVTLVLYYLLSFTGKQELLNLLLLLASIFFYAWGEPRYILLLFISVAVNYAGGMMIEHFRQVPSYRKAALALIVAINLLLLGYFKYYNFFADNINALFHGEIIPERDIVLPIGISFYTFQAMSYVIDLYRGRCLLQRSFFKLLLYIMFFPQLIAGPIVRYRDVAEQIDDRRTDTEKFALGIRRFIIGLGKKVLLANTFAEAVDTVFALSASDLSTAIAWYGIFLYSMQIYFDFSGYSDMAIGLGKMFGFDFMENFDFPYMASSIREFWRRWHISLSTWFKEYLYIPLGGNRKGRLRTYINLIIVFFATGFWHGAGWAFVLWGLIHGFFSIMERLFLGDLLEKNPIKPLNHIYTLLVTGIAWVLFRAEELPLAASYLSSMFSLRGIGDYGFFELFDTKCLALSAAGLLLCGIISPGLQKRITESGAFRIIGLPLIMLSCMAFLISGSYNPFIYFRF